MTHLGWWRLRLWRRRNLERGLLQRLVQDRLRRREHRLSELDAKTLGMALYYSAVALEPPLAPASTPLGAPTTNASVRSPQVPLPSQVLTP